jgi:hypothetical protein
LQKRKKIKASPYTVPFTVGILEIIFDSAFEFYKNGKGKN